MFNSEGNPLGIAVSGARRKGLWGTNIRADSHLSTDIRPAWIEDSKSHPYREALSRYVKTEGPLPIAGELVRFADAAMILNLLHQTAA